MRSLQPLDSRDLRELACPWCGRTPQRATFGLKVLRGDAVVGVLAAAPADELGEFAPSGAVCITQAWVRPEDVGELVGTQLVHRLAGHLVGRRVPCLVASGTVGVPDCEHLPAHFLERLGFTEHVAGHRWRLDLRRTVRVPDALRAARQVVGRLARPGRPAPANRGH